MKRWSDGGETTSRPWRTDGPTTALRPRGADQRKRASQTRGLRGPWREIGL